MIVRLSLEFWDEFRPVSRKGCEIRRLLLGSARRQAVDVDQNDRQAMATERLGQDGDALHALGAGMRRSESDDALLQIDRIRAVFGSSVVMAMGFSSRPRRRLRLGCEPAFAMLTSVFTEFAMKHMSWASWCMASSF